MIMEISISCISFVIIFDDLMLSALKIVFRIPHNDNIMNLIPNEKTNFVFEFSEFEFSEFECFVSISHSLITVLLGWTHKNVFKPVPGNHRNLVVISKPYLRIDLCN